MIADNLINLTPEIWMCSICEKREVDDDGAVCSPCAIEYAEWLKAREEGI